MPADKLYSLGYQCDWRLVNASHFQVFQLRPSAILIAMKRDIFNHFNGLTPFQEKPKSIGDLLFEEMGSLGWENAGDWKKQAQLKINN
jgi:DNA (cytosine-5)-methyltransferase 1